MLIELHLFSKLNHLCFLLLLILLLRQFLLVGLLLHLELLFQDLVLRSATLEKDLGLTQVLFGDLPPSALLIRKEAPDHKDGLFGG